MIGGELVTTLAEGTGAQILPVDSEHSALFQLIRSERPGTLEKLVLTASGGPFRGRTDLSGVSREEALAHPTWAMGGRITIDSATLMNKGFEMIEAHHLFGCPLRADRRGRPPAVARALTDPAQRRRRPWPTSATPTCGCRSPTRCTSPSARTSRFRSSTSPTAGSLDFEPPDPETFPALRLAREAGEAGGTAPCVLNAADEVAVEAFLAGRIPFTGIAEVVEATLEQMPATPARHFDDLFAADAQAREVAAGLIAAGAAA